VYREGGDFYVDRLDLDTGTVEWTGEGVPGVEITQEFDLTLRQNDSEVYNRTYHGLLTQFQYRFSDRLSLGGNWTWSHLYGNFNGENTSNGISIGTALTQPEYRQEEWNYPSGDLAQDQRHNVRAFLVWDAISTGRHNLAVSWLENFSTGTPYGAIQSALVSHPGVPEGIWIPNPGYINPPMYADYYFTDRDEFRTDDIHRTDISVNYSFFVNALGGQLELYIQPEVINLFNEQGVWNPNTTTLAWRNSWDHELFDPFSEAPTEGYHWGYGSNFGGADVEDDYQLPRTFRISLGIRF
jgi:hypothetical protein